MAYTTPQTPPVTRDRESDAVADRVEDRSVDDACDRRVDGVEQEGLGHRVGRISVPEELRPEDGERRGSSASLAFMTTTIATAPARPQTAPVRRVTSDMVGSEPEAP